MNRFLKEPLLHFLVLGAAMFAAYGFLSRHSGDEPRRVVITQGQISTLAAGFEKTWQRPPTEEELDGLIRDRVREEVLCREAMVIGLDRDDTIIRRRLRQKMEFVSEDIAAQTEPTDAELQSFLESHVDVFRTETRFTFQHVYLNPQKHGETLARDVSVILAQLQSVGGGAEITDMGDSSLLESRFADASQSEVAKQFGEEFVAGLALLSPGHWEGPIASGFGVHLVFVSERAEGRIPVLAEARDAIRREWENARRLEANERFYQELLKRYTVTVEAQKTAAP